MLDNRKNILVDICFSAYFINGQRTIRLVYVYCITSTILIKQFYSQL